MDGSWYEYGIAGAVGVAIKGGFDYLKSKLKSDTDIAIEEIRASSQMIEELKQKNMELEEALEHCDDEYKNLEVKTTKEITKLKFKYDTLKDIVQVLGKDNKEVMEMIKKLDKKD